MGVHFHKRTVLLCSLAVTIAYIINALFPDLRAGYQYGAVNHLDKYTVESQNESLPKVSVPFGDQRQHQLGRRNIVKRLDTPDAILKGTSLLCLMNADLQDAQKMTQNDEKWINAVVQSLFLNPAAEFTKWGWDITESGEEVEDFFSQYELQPLMDMLHLSTAEPHWFREEVDHRRAWNVDGKQGPALRLTTPYGFEQSHAMFDTMMNRVNGDTSDPAIILLRMYAAAPAVKGLIKWGALPESSLPPDLQKCSDLVFLLYYHFTQVYLANVIPNIAIDDGSPIPAPKHFIIPGIVTEETLDIFEDIWRTRSLQFVNSPGIRFEPDTVEGRAILGTPHGAAVSFFLLQHKQIFGVKTVTGMRVWRTQDNDWSAYFEIGDYVPPQPVGVFNQPGLLPSSLRARL